MINPALFSPSPPRPRPRGWGVHLSLDAPFVDPRSAGCKPGSRISLRLSSVPSGPMNKISYSLSRRCERGPARRPAPRPDPGTLSASTLPSAL